MTGPGPQQNSTMLCRRWLSPTRTRMETKSRSSSASALHSLRSEPFNNLGLHVFVVETLSEV